MKIPLSILVVLISITTSSSWKLNVDENSESDETVYRLPETVVPTYYDLSLTIDLANTTFAGTVIILFDVNGNVTVNQIPLHFDKDYITIKSIKLNNKIDCTAGAPNEASISILKCTGSVSGEDNFLLIKYKAKFSTDGYGLVKTSYLDQGEEETIIESVFAPTFARRAFPCLDEPSLRVTFLLQINHPEGYSAISNSRVTHVMDFEDSITTVFDLTPKISTYLLSIVISKFHSTKVILDGGYDFRIFTRTDVVNSTTKVLQNYSNAILDYLDNYTGVSYNDIKEKACYQVALPEYSEKTGGFGLFKYSEIDLLDDGEQTTQRTVQDIVTNVAYKLAHEWYGGYLTVSWWSDIWSNEAVATYISYTVADKVTNNFKIRSQFILEVVRKLLQTDAYSFAQPLSSSKSDISDVDSITKKLDTVSYQKGASILQMIKYMVGDEDTFRANLVKHLFERNETATDGSDLIKDLTEDQSTKDKDLNAYLQSWVFSPGFPLVTAKVVNVTESGINTIKLSQKRFLYPTNDEKVDDKTQWVIPVNTVTSEEEFQIRVDGYDVPGQDTYYYRDMDSYCIFNVGSGFLYRVNYDEILWNSIISNLKIVDNYNINNIVDSLTRAQLVDDIFNIARIGEVSYSKAFELADFLKNETSYYPWYAAFDAFSYLLGKIGNDVAEENFKVYILGLMNKVLMDTDKVTSKAQIDVLRKVMVTEWACKLNDTETVKKIVNQFEKITSDPSSLEDPNLRSVIYCNGIRYSDNVLEYTNHLWNIYTNSTSVHEKMDLLKAIGCAENEAVLDVLYLLKIIKPDSEIKGEDAIIAFKSIFSSSMGVSAAKTFLDINITEVVSLGKNIWPEMLYALAERLYTNDDLKWINDKLDNKIFNGYDEIKSKIRTLVAVNNYWANNFQVYVREIFLRNPTTTTTTTTTIKTTSVVSTTTQRTPTTTDSGSSVVIPNFIASVSVLTLLIIHNYV